MTKRAIACRSPKGLSGCGRGASNLTIAYSGRATIGGALPNKRENNDILPGLSQSARPFHSTCPGGTPPMGTLLQPNARGARVAKEKKDCRRRTSAAHAGARCQPERLNTLAQ